MAVKTNVQGLIDKIKTKALLVFVDSANDIALELSENIKDEIPKRTGKAADSVKLIPAEIRGSELVIGGVSIGDDEAQYVRTLWKGIPESADLYQYPNEKAALAFPATAWEGAPIQPNTDGGFVFAKTKRWQPANDFIERAVARLGSIKRFFAKNFKLEFK